MKKVIFLSLIILFSIKTQNISANQNIFAVDNIEVNSELTTNNNIAVITSTHRNATAIPQPSPQSPSISIGNSTSIPQNLTSIP